MTRLPSVDEIPQRLANDRDWSIDDDGTMSVAFALGDDDRSPRHHLEIAQSTAGHGREPKRRFKHCERDRARYRVSPGGRRCKHTVPPLVQERQQLFFVHCKVEWP